MEPFRTNVSAVPRVPGLRSEDGWVDMQVQFLIDNATAGSADFLLGWTVLPPGARHDRHRHGNADEFFLVLAGEGMIYTDHGTEPSGRGDVIFTPRGHWHGFDNTSDADVVLVWGWTGAGSLEAAGYETEATANPS
ncbi:MAG TPA: cupin domain-containing protein [Acidimicrobiia bacterium]|nr:cupin domain-containing protein [Acidimicrobiia bacterium]